MVEADSFQLCQQHPIEDSPNLSHMSTTMFQLGQQNDLPSCLNLHTFTPNVTFPVSSVTGLFGLNTCQSDGAHRLFQHLPPHLEGSHLAPNPYGRESQCGSAYQLGVTAAPVDVAGLSQKRFFIFDQSGSQTRLFLSPFCSPLPNLVVAPKIPVNACSQHEGKQVAIIDQISQTKLHIEGKSDANHLIGEESEMHEDTEEINALLYSDDDEKNDDHDHDLDGEDDEVISTGHSPFATKGIDGKRLQVKGIAEEFASSDASNKRQRLLDGEYRKFSLIDTASSMKPNKSSDYDDEAESSYDKGRIQGEGLCSILGNSESTRGKIWATLRSLESIIPGIKGHDPLLVIDEAINYLTSLKDQAKALGIGYF